MGYLNGELCAPAHESTEIEREQALVAFGGTASGCFEQLFGAYQEWIQQRMQEVMAGRRGSGPGSVQELIDLLRCGGGLETRSALDGYTPLEVACAAGHSETVRALLRLGANPRANAARSLRVAAAHGFAEIVGILLYAGVEVDHADAAGRTALHVAAANGKAGVVQFLIAAGADRDRPNRRGETPWQEAMAHAHFDLVVWLC
ncbi:ankyrin repeat domain-containing protein [Nocardia inohanensis]|uniref:ankyrin repeat domain-containing protein n=1 Tax=Nocardia inohanensis TaxID=209246 RepID=UPI0008372AB2|nr:ankyrin repeat domain-containing protein [Nocardia inohanensis]